MSQNCLFLKPDVPQITWRQNLSAPSDSFRSRSRLSLTGISRALLVYPDWGELILSGEKIWELRSCITHFRGRFGIIYAGTGKIFGTAELVDSLPPIDPDHFTSHFANHRVPQGNVNIREKYRYPWLLRNPIKFIEPIPYRHPRGAVKWVILRE